MFAEFFCKVDGILCTFAFAIPKRKEMGAFSANSFVSANRGSLFMGRIIWPENYKRDTIIFGIARCQSVNSSSPAGNDAFGTRCDVLPDINATKVSAAYNC